MSPSNWAAQTAAGRRDGYWARRSTPYGYRREGTPPRELLVPDAHAPIARGVLLMLAAGASATSVAKRLDAAKAPPPGRAWTRQNVLALAREPAYMGYVRDGEALAVGRFEPLVDERVWDAANSSAARRAAARLHGVGKARAQREAFELGYWHHQRTPRACVRAGGTWPRYVLAPGPRFPQVRQLLERLAAGGSVVEAEMAVKEVLKEAVSAWKNPAEAAARALRRYALNPVFAGVTFWTNGKGTRVEFRPARWAPFVGPEVLAAAHRRVHGREPPWLRVTEENA